MRLVWDSLLKKLVNCLYLYKWNDFSWYNIFTFCSHTYSIKLIYCIPVLVSQFFHVKSVCILSADSTFSCTTNEKKFLSWPVQVWGIEAWPYFTLHSISINNISQNSCLYYIYCCCFKKTINFAMSVCGEGRGELYNTANYLIWSSVFCPKQFIKANGYS